MNRIEQCFELEFREEWNQAIDAEIAGVPRVRTQRVLMDSYLYRHFVTPEAPRETRRSNECPKCGGTGYIREYAFRAGGVCFRCGGTGRAH